MRLETKFMRLKTPVTIGSRFGEWLVYWLGLDARRRSYLVMRVRITDLDQIDIRDYRAHGSDADLSEPAITPF
jgi:hypothetical protein